MSKAAAGMAASKQETLFLPVDGKNKMPDGFGRFIVGVNKVVKNVDCRNKVLSSIIKEIDGAKRELNAKNKIIVQV